MFSFRGTVRDVLNRPLAGAFVADQNNRTTTTAANGNYVLGESSAGQFTLRSWRSDTLTRTQVVDATIPVDQNVDFTLQYRIAGGLSSSVLSTATGANVSTLTIISYAPLPGSPGESGGTSCVWVKDSRRLQAELPATWVSTDAATGAATWTYSIAPGINAVEGSFAVTFVAKECSTGTALTPTPAALSYVIDNTAPVISALMPANGGNSSYEAQPLLARVFDYGSGAQSQAMRFTLFDETAGTSSSFGGSEVIYSASTGWAKTAAINLVRGHVYRLSFSVSDKAGNQSSIVQSPLANGGGFLSNGVNATATISTMPRTPCVLTDSSEIGFKTATCSPVVLTLDPSEVTIAGSRNTGVGYVSHRVELVNTKVGTTLPNPGQGRSAAQNEIWIDAYRSNDALWNPRSLTTTFEVTQATPSAQVLQTPGVVLNIGALVTRVPATWTNAFLEMQETELFPATYSSASVVGCVDPSVFSAYCNPDPVPFPLSILDLSPSRGIAGDALTLRTKISSLCGTGLADECRDTSLTAYIVGPDGAEHALADIGSNTSPQTLSLDVGWDKVRFPSLRYRFEVTQEMCRARSDCQNPGSWSVVSVSWPESGYVQIPVDNKVRIRFLKSDGTPAANVRVVAAHSEPGSSEAWIINTSSNGWAKFFVPSDDPWMRQRQASPGYENIFMRVFDAWPTALLGDVEQVSGNGLYLGMVINLGEEFVQAVDITLQDHTFTLRPETLVVTSGNPENECDSTPSGVTVCNRHVETYRNVGKLPVANRVGGGGDIKGSFHYQNTVNTQSTFLMSAGGGWAESEGEVQSETEQTAGLDSVWYGGRDQFDNPAPDNRRIELGWDFERVEVMVCYNDQGTTYCPTWERIVPKQWNLEWEAVQTSHFHDQARDMGGPDCTRRIGIGKTKSGTGQGHRISYNIGIGGSWYGLRARVKWSGSETQTVHALQEWEAEDPSLFHHIYIRNGLSGSGEDVCPIDAPSRIWTDSSDHDKSNPPNPVPPGYDPCDDRISCGEYGDELDRNLDWP